MTARQPAIAPRLDERTDPTELLVVAVRPLGALGIEEPLLQDPELVLDVVREAAGLSQALRDALRRGHVAERQEAHGAFEAQSSEDHDQEKPCGPTQSPTCGALAHERRPVDSNSARFVQIRFSAPNRIPARNPNGPVSKSP